MVLDRGRENRSQFVFTRARRREVIFWQSARTANQARPAVSTPTRRASGLVLEILVDSHERYPWKFSAQQATTRRQALPAGGYAVETDGRIVAVVERKSLADLSSTLTTGKLRYLLAALDELPRAALVVEDRYSAVFKSTFVTPGGAGRGPGRGAGPVPGGADRVLRDATAGTGVDLPVPGRALRKSVHGRTPTVTLSRRGSHPGVST